MILAAITTCKRKPDMVERAVKSVVAQTYRDWNLVVVDDSPADYEFRDDVRKMVERYAEKDSRIRYVPHDRNYGAQRARNTALDIADREGYEFIAYLDDDDEWLPEKLEKQLAVFMNHDEKLGLVYCIINLIYINPITHHEYSVRHVFKQYCGDVYGKLLSGDFIGTFSNPLIRTKYLKIAGGMDENVPSHQDWETWLRVSKVCEISYINKPLFNLYREDGIARVSGHYKKVPQAIDIIEHKNLDYLREHKYIYWQLCRYKIKIYGFNGDYERGFNTWLKAISLQPMRIFSNIWLVIIGLLHPKKFTLKIREKSYKLFMYLRLIKHIITGEKIN